MAAVNEPAADGERRLFEVWRRLPGQQRRKGRAVLSWLRDLARRVREDWKAFGGVQWAEGAPETNHRTEHAIWRMRMRAWTARGESIAA